MEAAAVRQQLGWGYNPGLPKDEDGIFRGAAWGARCIWQGSGRPDILHDRQDTLGPEDERTALLKALNDGAGEQWMGNVERRVPSLRPNVGEEWTAYDEGPRGIVVKVNTMGSFGYLYVVAYVPAGYRHRKARR